MSRGTGTPPETFERIPIFGENGRLIHRAVADTIVAQHDLCATDAGSTTTFYEYADGYWKQISPRVIRKTIQDVIGDVATHSHIRSSAGNYCRPRVCG